MQRSGWKLSDGDGGSDCYCWLDSSEFEFSSSSDILAIFTLKIFQLNGINFHCWTGSKGFTQVHGVDYYNTWAPAAKLASICLLLAITAQNNWTIDMFDFHSAFLNGEINSDKEVFMEQPLGYEQSDSNQYICKLFKSLYGLKQAGHKWYNTLCRTLAKIRFKWSSTDPAVFYIHQGSNIIVLACHINNCTIIGTPHDLVQSYKDKLKAKYSLTDLGEVKWLLGIKMMHDLEAQTISLSQSMYIDSILTRFNLNDLKLFATPMDPSIQLSKDQCPSTPEEVAEMCKVPYQEAVGSLNYCTVATWPDITFSVSLLAQFMENPSCIHWEAVKWVFRYLLEEINVWDHCIRKKSNLPWLPLVSLAVFGSIWLDLKIWKNAEKS